MGWGGKGDSGGSAQTYYPERKQDEENLDASVAAAMEMMAQQQNIFAQQMSQMNQPQELTVPSIAKSPEVDWSEKQEQLRAKSKADFNLDKARRKTRTDTILTSPLLDDDDAETTESLLKG